MHYHMPYPTTDQDGSASFFHESGDALKWSPREPELHKPLDLQQFLNKKLRWTTLGGQYDWTNKVYPEGQPPAFPNDIKSLVEKMFPMKAEAAIVR